MTLRQLINFLSSYKDEDLYDFQISVTSIPANLDSRNLLLKTDIQDDLFGGKTGRKAILTHDTLHD